MKRTSITTSDGTTITATTETVITCRNTTHGTRTVGSIIKADADPTKSAFKADANTGTVWGPDALHALADLVTEHQNQTSTEDRADQILTDLRALATEWEATAHRFNKDGLATVSRTAGDAARAMHHLVRTHTRSQP